MQLMLGAAGLAGASSGVISTLQTVGTVLSAASTGAQLIGGLRQADQSERIAQWNAANLHERAREEELSGAVDAARLRRRNRAENARQFAAFSATGGATGTAYDVLDASAVNRELDALTLQFNGQQRGRSLDAQAGAALYQGQAQATAARAGAYGGAFGSVMSLDPLNFDGGDDNALSLAHTRIQRR